MVRNAKQKGIDMEPFSEELATALKELWASEPIQRAYSQRDYFVLHDSTKYFLDSVSRIAEPNYEPNTQDCLCVRIPSTGINVVRFQRPSLKIIVVDVGGQKSERRKWMHAFDDVSAVLFISSVAEYDQKMREDETKNRMEDSMEIFGAICGNVVFEQATIIFFMNKIDLFTEKVQRVPITVFFGNYEGPLDCEASLEYIKERFTKIAYKKKPNRRVDFHATCATDTKQVEQIIDSVLNLLTAKNNKETGLD